MPANARPMTQSFFVSPQITSDDIAAAARDGFTVIINNRTDGETPGQPSSAAMQEAVEAAGLHYAHIPVDRMGVTPAHTAALETAMHQAGEGKVLAFCASGLRSALVYAYGEARFGKPVDQIIAEAAAAGYDISGHEPALVLLHDAHKAPRTNPPV